MQAVLDEVAARLLPGTTLSHAICELLTFGGRMPLEHGLLSLTDRQAALLRRAAHTPLQQPSDTPPPADTVHWTLGVWSHGRIWLAPEPPAHPECRIVATLAVPALWHEGSLIRARECELVHALRDEEMQRFFAALDDGALADVLDGVHEALDHMDPVLLYIGDETFTNFAKFNNLQERNAADLPGCFFRRVRTMARDDWTDAERKLVFCLHWLRAAGCRGEEFNGRQLDPTLVDAYLQRELETFHRRLRLTDATVPYAIADKAHALAQCRARASDRLLAWRWINGLNFCKEQRYTPRGALPPSIGAVPQPLWPALACGDDSLTPDEAARRCVERFAGRGFERGQDGLNSVERLLRDIVLAAVEATGSDVGMTRGVRDIDALRRAMQEQRHADICDWPATAYFCGVFASPATREALREQPAQLAQLAKMLHACAARMQFNSWHYMPGHLPRASVPRSRHYYAPPRMPDITIWSDQHHNGHQLAEVRYCIRSPAPVSTGGRVYPGLVDLRLYRRSDPPYTESELWQALAYTECVRALNQALADHVERTGLPVVLNAFDRAWYQRTHERGEAHA